MSTWVASTSCLSWIVLPWTCLVMVAVRVPTAEGLTLNLGHCIQLGKFPGPLLFQSLFQSCLTLSGSRSSCFFQPFRASNVWAISFLFHFSLKTGLSLVHLFPAVFCQRKFFWFISQSDGLRVGCSVPRHHSGPRLLPSDGSLTGCTRRLLGAWPGSSMRRFFCLCYTGYTWYYGP